MCYVLRPVTLRLLWTDRNSRLFNRHDPMRANPALRVIYLTLCIQVRARLRRSYDELHSSLLYWLSQGRRESVSRGLMKRNDLLFHVRYMSQIPAPSLE